MSQTFFHVAFVAVFVGFTAIRAAYNRKAEQERGAVEYKEGQRHVLLRLIFGIPFMLLLVGYVVWPRLLGWAALPLPRWSQWLGLALGLVSLPLVWWVQWALGANFSTTLHVRDEHTLVTHGPYRWVRHPMYTVLYVHLLALFLLTANGFIGGVPLVALTLIVVTRLSNEEATMTEVFGDRYRHYAGRTGRFLPRLVG